MRNVSRGTLKWLLGFTIISLNLFLTYRCLELTSGVSDDQIYNIPPSNTYSALVVFGDSFSDNGHTRPAEYQKFLSSPPSFDGRLSDGLVWDEFLAQNLSVDFNITFLNYAYNGAHIKNNLSIFPYPLPPDTSTQIQLYLDDLQQYVKQTVSPNEFDARILHTMWIGINPLITAWNKTIHAKKPTNGHTLLGPDLTQKLDENIRELRLQLNQMLNDHNLLKFETDYMLMTIPPLTNTLLVRDTASLAAGGDPTLTQKYSNLFSDMTDYFNFKLIQRIEKIKLNLSNSAGKSRIFVFNTGELWREVESKPWLFGFDSSGSCFSDPKKPPCGSPSRYMYWDTLHPSSTLHAHLSYAILSFLQGVDEWPFPHPIVNSFGIAGDLSSFE